MKLSLIDNKYGHCISARMLVDMAFLLWLLDQRLILIYLKRKALYWKTQMELANT